MRARPPQEIGGYRLLGPLGAGGMGTVYRALDGDGRTVALKLLHPHLGADPDARERLRREVASLRRVRHPGVARVLDAEIDSSDAFVVTELVEGRDLATEVATGGPLDGAALADLADRLRAALEAVHDVGVLHRDLTPGNVMMTADGPVLIDFGIAQAAEDPRVTSTGLVTGTPGYLAPELLDGGEPDQAGDWWGWAGLLVFAATGRPPFGSGPVAAVLARARGGEADLDGVGWRTASALRAALEVDPGQRAEPVRVVEELWAADGDDDYAADDADGLATTIVGNDGRTRVLPGAEPDGGWYGPATPPGREAAYDDAAAYPAGAPDEGWASDDDADWPEAPEEEPPVLPEPPRRVGAVLALAAPLVALGAGRPGLALVIGAGLAVLARSVGLDAEATSLRRARRGRRATDVTRGLVTWPWYLARAVVGVVPAALIATGLVVGVGGLLWWLAGSDRLVVAAADGSAGVLPGNGEGAGRAALAALVAIGLAALWFGPMARTTRVGARWVLDAVAPGVAGGAAVGLLALVAAGVIVAAATSGDVVWWPMTGPPAIG